MTESVFNLKTKVTSAIAEAKAGLHAAWGKVFAVFLVWWLTVKAVPEAILAKVRESIGAALTKLRESGEKTAGTLREGGHQLRASFVSGRSFGQEKWAKLNSTTAAKKSACEKILAKLRKSIVDIIDLRVKRDFFKFVVAIPKAVCEGTTRRMRVCSDYVTAILQTLLDKWKKIIEKMCAAVKLCWETIVDKFAAARTAVTTKSSRFVGFLRDEKTAIVLFVVAKRQAVSEFSFSYLRRCGERYASLREATVFIIKISKTVGSSLVLVVDKV